MADRNIVKTYTLEYPVEVGAEKLTQIHLHRPTVKDLRLHDVSIDQDFKATAEGMFRLLCACTDTAPVMVERMDGWDLKMATDEIDLFMSRSLDPQNGNEDETSS